MKMNYYLLFEEFTSGEGSFTTQPPQRSALRFPKPQHKLVKSLPVAAVDECYEERGMSDFLKVGIAFLASPKVQTVFFECGFLGLQFIPVIVENDGVINGFAFTNALAHYDILDPVASEVERYEESRGGYSNASDEIFDRNKFESCDFKHDVFTLSNYKYSLVANEKVKIALEEAGVTGIEFIPLEFSS